MNNELDKNAQLDVRISDIYATDEELEKFTHLIIKGLGKNATALTFTPMSSTKKGICYQITFRVLNPEYFSDLKVREWLLSASLVGWQIDSKLVHP